MCEEGRGASCFGTKERPGVEGRVDCPKTHPFQELGQELTLLLPTSTLYVPGASGSG